MNRLRWKCRRGMLELDIMLNKFLEEGYQALTKQQQQDFNELLEYPDTVLLELLMGNRAAPKPAIAYVIRHIQRSTCS